MKILQVNDYRTFGGAEFVCIHLSDWLRRRGHQVWNLTAEDSPTFLGTSIWRRLLDLYPSRPLNYSQVKDHLMKIRPDVVHLHNFSIFGTGLPRLMRKMSIPTVFSTHDFWAVSPNRNLLRTNKNLCRQIKCPSCAEECINIAPKWIHPINQLLAPLVRLNIVKRRKQIEDNIDAIVGTSEFSSGIMRTFFNKKNVQTIYNGLMLESYRRSSDHHMKEPYLLYAGGFQQVKGFHHAVHIAKKLFDSRETRTVITGRMPPDSTVKKFHHIDFVGNLPRQDFIDTLASAFALILPSIVHEVLPTVVIEAMIMQVPVVAYAVGGVPELVTNAQNGFLADVGDVGELYRNVLMLVDNPNQAKAMGKTGRMKAESNFTMKRMGEEYIRLYESVIGNPRDLQQ